MTWAGGFNWRGFARSRAAVLAVWSLFALVALALLPLTGIEPHGPDDWMRLFQVRDLLAGQSWWDVTQYRIDPPVGASMHWSRLVDLPLVAVALVPGEAAALIAVPLLYLLAALFCLRSIMLRLGFGPLAMALGYTILPLFPLLPGNFVPMRIDHHTPQAVIALACAALLLRRTKLAAILAGALAAAWVVISLEGLPMVAALAALFGLLYLWRGERLIGWHLAALAIAAPLLSLATRPLSELGPLYCDVLAPGHMLAFAAAALMAALLPWLPGQATMRGRLIALSFIPLICAPLAWAGLGECAAGPFAQLDPLLRTYWHGFIGEGLPIWPQRLSVAAMLLWTGALIGAGWYVAERKGSLAREEVTGWTLLALFASAGFVYSLTLMRVGLLTQLLAVPFAAFLLAHFLPRARAIPGAVPRILATLACFLLLTPAFAGAALKPLDPLAARDSLRRNTPARIEGPECDYSRLAALPAGHVLVPLDSGPQVLGQTPHTIVAASYHRNQSSMRDVIEAFTESESRARLIARAHAADYVVACSSEADLALYRTAAPGNFANRAATGGVGDWLEPVAGFDEGSLRVYRVRWALRPDHARNIRRGGNPAPRR